jgi:predicted MFS family arabinose efflux permease
VGWFVQSRGLALGLSLVGTGIVGALMPSYVNGLVAAYGWRGAYLGLAVLPLILGLPVALIWFREPPEDRADRVDRSSPAGPAGPVAAASPHPAAGTGGHGQRFAQAVRTWCFWQLSLALVIAALAVSGVLVHSLPLLTDRGISRGAAAALAGLFGLAVTFGRLLSGGLMDRFGGPLVGAVMFAAPALACVVLLFAGVNLALCAAAILCCGVAAGAESDVAGYLAAQYFGRLHFSAIYGLLYALYGIGAGIGPALMGAAYDRTGSYDLALQGAAVAFLCAALLIATVRPPRPRADRR